MNVWEYFQSIMSFLCICNNAVYANDNIYVRIYILLYFRLPIYEYLIFIYICRHRIYVHLPLKKTNTKKLLNFYKHLTLECK